MHTLITDNAPSGRGFVTLLEAFRATGGTAPCEVVGRLLADHHTGEAVSLAKRVHSGQVFGFAWRSSLWIPMFQFNADDLSIATAPQGVRAELPEIWSGWTVAMWFAMPNARLDGHRPVDLLAPNVAAVLRAAAALPPAEDLAVLQARQARALAAHA